MANTLRLFLIYPVKDWSLNINEGGSYATILQHDRPYHYCCYLSYRCRVPPCRYWEDLVLL